MRKVLSVALVALVLAGSSALVFAGDGEKTEPTVKAQSQADVQTKEGKALPASGSAYFVTAAGIGLSLAIAAAFGAMGQSKAIAASVEAMARQPEAGGRIFTSMIIGLALIETLVIYTLVIAFTLAGKLA